MREIAVSPNSTDWTRFNGEPCSGNCKRLIAECETKNDLSKPIQQLLCDVHEEIIQGRTPEENLAHAIKRMVAMQARVALDNEQLSKRLVFLTWSIAILTVVLVALTVIMLIKMP